MWRRVPRDGGNADPHQVEDAAATARPGAGRRGGGSAPVPRRPAARVPEVQTAANLLHERETLRSAPVAAARSAVAAIAAEEVEPELEVDLFSLMAAFKAVLESCEEPADRADSRGADFHRRPDLSSCWGGCRKREACGFEELFEDALSRGALIVTFLALLEMIRIEDRAAPRRFRRDLCLPDGRQVMEAGHRHD